MHCPACEFRDTKVVDSRLSDIGHSIRRRRQCDKCHFRFTTFERIQTAELIVIKRDETTEPYDRDKIERGILTACSKRPVSLERIREKLNELEDRWGKSKEISTQIIGSKIMKILRELDEIAFIRFASVYQNFNSVAEFTDLLKEQPQK